MKDLDLIYATARELPPEERPAYLTEACGGDNELRRRLEQMLAVADKAEAFITDLPDAESEEREPGRGTVKVRPHEIADMPDETVGQRIGRYKILEKVGEGGCGVVYVAEQTEPVRLRVALKVIKLGMDTRQVVARFEAERQALAMMDHPNIAKVLDAGTTESPHPASGHPLPSDGRGAFRGDIGHPPPSDGRGAGGEGILRAGRPYFVMELVRGIKMTDYCDQASLPTKERLNLFIQVCHAIQHAHQKGIIHRDIKPSNILVTLNDGVPVPKVIDFGIAKATEGRLTEATVYTQLHQFIGTPAYMSPEQAEMSSLDIDTRSDIYSLGVLLYELLAGTTPFDGKELISLGLDAMRKAIREKDPVRPSTRLATLQRNELTTAAKRRAIEAPKLIHLLKGDLDWIVMKCLEKDRTRRYETANGLAFDLKRHLNNEPVLARPPSAGYRLQKAFRRNKMVFCSVAAVAAALVAGTGISLWQTLQARKAQRETEAARQGEQQQRMQAQSAEKLARAQELAARRIAYASDMNAVQQALTANNLGRAQMLLNRQKPQPGQLDLRGWEWRYLWGQTHPEEHEVFFPGTNRLHSLSFNPDGRLLARSDDQETVVADVLSHRTVWQRSRAVRAVFAHHGTALVFADASSEDEAVTLFDMATQRETHIAPSLGTIYWVEFTPDDQRVVTVSRRLGVAGPASLTVWDVNSRKQLWQTDVERVTDQDGGGQPYAISPDGNAIAAGAPDHRVHVFEMRDGSERFAMKTTEEIPMSVAFSRDSSTIATSAGYSDSTIRLWDAHNGKSIGSLEGHPSWVSDLVFAPDGKLLISSSADQTIRLWDWPALKPAGVLRGHLDEVDGLALAPDGQTLVSRCKDGSIYRWDVKQQPRRGGYQILPTRMDTYGATLTLDSRFIMAIKAVRPVDTLVQCDLATLQTTPQTWGNTTNRSDDFHFSPDGRWLVWNTYGHLHVWDIRNGLERTNFVAGPDDLTGCDFTANGKLFVTLHGPSTNAVLETWDPNTWHRASSRILHYKDSNNSGGSFSVLSSYSIVDNGAVYLFDVSDPGRAPKRIEKVLGFNDFQVSPDGRFASASYNNSGLIRLWDMATGQLVDSFTGFLLSPNALAFSPDSLRLAVTSVGQEAVKLWDVENRQEVLTLGGEGAVLRGLKFSPDGRFLVAINSFSVVYLWSAPSWEEIAVAEAKEKTGIKQP